MNEWMNIWMMISLTHLLQWKEASGNEYLWLKKKKCQKVTDGMLSTRWMSPAIFAEMELNSDLKEFFFS